MNSWLYLYPAYSIKRIAKRFGVPVKDVLAFLVANGVTIQQRGGRINENLALQNKALRRGK